MAPAAPGDHPRGKKKRKRESNEKLLRAQETEGDRPADGGTRKDRNQPTNRAGAHGAARQGGGRGEGKKREKREESGGERGGKEAGGKGGKEDGGRRTPRARASLRGSPKAA